MTVEDRLRKVLARHPGPLYQTHTWGGVELNVGVRGVERRTLLDLADVRGRHVLDLGCATGAETNWATEQGAAFAVGVDALPEHVRTATLLALTAPPPPACFLEADLSAGLPPLLRETVFDTVLAFSITHHVGWRPLWEEVAGATVAYVEGGGGSPYTADALSRNGWRAVLLGRTPGNRASFEPSRPVFRLVREG